MAIFLIRHINVTVKDKERINIMWRQRIKIELFNRLTWNDGKV
jgi:hypothetical protein